MQKLFKYLSTFTVLSVLSIIGIRLYLLQLPSLGIDMNTWKAWTERLITLGPTQFYNPDYFSDYLPGYLYMLYGLGMVLKVLFPGAPIDSSQFEFLLKFLTTCFDFATAYVIYKIVANYQKNLAAVAGILYVANPALIFNSAIWGQVDGIFTFFLVLAAYYLFELRKLIYWAATFAIGLVIKPHMLAVLPVMGVYLLEQFRLKRISSSLAILVTLPILISLPFFLSNPIFGLLQQMRSGAEQYSFTSLYAFNTWAFVVGWWKNDTVIQFGMSLQVIGLLLFMMSLVAILFPRIENVVSKTQQVVKKKSNDSALLIHTNVLYYQAASLSILAFFLFPTRIHERYLFPFFAFVLIAAAIARSKLLFLCYTLLSVIHLANLWYVYFYFNTVHSNPLFTGNDFFTFIDSSYKLMSILTLISFGMMLLSYYRKTYVQKAL